MTQAGIAIDIQPNGVVTITGQGGIGASAAFTPVVTGSILGDGVTDNTVNLQAVLDAARLAGGGRVSLPAGTFIAAGLTIGSNVKLSGVSPAATTLKLKNGANVDLLTTFGFAGLTGGTTTGGPTKFQIEDMTLDGNKANNTTGRCLAIYGSSYRIVNVEFWNGATGGVSSEWGSGGTDMEAQWLNFKIRDWKAGDGLSWSGPHDSQFANGIVASLDSNITSGGSTVRGIYLKGSAAGGRASGECFHNVHTWGRAHYGYYGDRTPFFATGGIAEGAYTSNVLIGGSGTVWSGGSVYGSNGSNGTVESGFQIGISAVSAVARSVIVGTFLNNFAATSFPFDFDNTAGKNMIQTAGILGGATAWSKQAIFTGTSGDWVETIASDSVGKSILHTPVMGQFPGGIQTFVKAGAPTDADFTAPTVGLMVLDTTNSKWWVRTAAATWKGVVIA